VAVEPIGFAQLIISLRLDGQRCIRHGSRQAAIIKAAQPVTMGVLDFSDLGWLPRHRHIRHVIP
jgi:hypothetical protein